MTKSYLTIISAVCLLVIFSLLMTGCDKKIASTTPETNLKTEENTKTPDSADKTPEKTDADLTADSETETPSPTAIESETPDTKPKYPDYDIDSIIVGNVCPLCANEVFHTPIPGKNYYSFDTTDYYLSEAFQQRFEERNGCKFPENPVHSIFIRPVALPERFEMTEEGKRIFEERPEDRHFDFFADYILCFGLTEEYFDKLNAEGVSGESRIEFREECESLGMEKLAKYLDELAIPYAKVKIGADIGLNALVTTEQLKNLRFDDLGMHITGGLGVHRGLDHPGGIRGYKDGVITISAAYKCD